jgi:hypothetical protein
MLNYIFLENFRAFGRPTTIPLAPITLFFGENSAGKTSILHALSLLKQTVESDDPNTVLVVRDSGGIVDFGSFREFVSDHDTKRILHLGLGLSGGSLGHLRTRSYEPMQPRGLSYILRRDNLGVDFAFKQAGKAKDIEWASLGLTDGEAPRPQVTFRPERESAVEADLEPEELPLAAEETIRFRADQSSVAPQVFEQFQSIWRQYTESFRILLAAVDHGRVRMRHRFGADEQSAGKALKEAIEDWRSLADPSCTDEQLRKAFEAEFESWTFSGYHLFGGLHAPTSSSLLEFMRAAEPHVRRSERAALQALEGMTLIDGNLKMRRALFATRWALERYIPIGPFRRPAERLYTYSGTKPSQVGFSGERVADLLHRDSRTLDRTNRWLSTFGIGYRLELKALGTRRSDVFEVRLVDQRRRPRIDIAFTDVGFGISQMLPIVVQSVGFKERIISIEQPEVHVHPRLQAEIGDLLVECVRNNGHQFLIETHSEHLILRLRRLIREGKLRPDEVSVVHVARGKDGAFVERIGLNRDGTFASEWPGGFFPERMRELL